MRNITVGVFEHLKINSPMDVDKRLSYKQRILRGAVLKKQKEIMVTCRQSAKALVGDEWTLLQTNWAIRGIILYLGKDGYHGV